MKKYHVIYAPAALDDLKGIFSYIAFALKEKQTAARLTERIRAAVRSLAEMPERCAPVDWEPWSGVGMRKLPVGNYVIFYLTDTEKQQVTVIRIFYGGQDIGRIVASDSHAD